MTAIDGDELDLSGLLTFVEPPAGGAVRARADGTRRRRRRTVGALMASLALLGAALSGVQTHRSSSQQHVRAGEPSTPAAPTTSAPLPPKLPEAALPTGWKPVDYGDVRLSVPPQTQVVGPGASWCREPLLLKLGASGPPPSCPALGDRNPTTVQVTLTPPKTVPTGGRTINGLRAVRVLDSGGERRYVVPELSAFIRLSGPQADAILRTLNPSSRWRALHELASQPTSGWQTITGYGVQITVPPVWPTQRLAPNDDDPRLCSKPFRSRGLWIGRGRRAAPTCPPPPWTPGWTNGVWLRPSDEPPHANGATRTQRRVQVTVLASDPQQSVIELELMSHGKPVLVTIGVDRDPGIAAAIVGSIQVR